MEEREKKMTPEESVEVMQRMVHEAQRSAHFTGRPFILSGVFLGCIFLAMAALYAFCPDKEWKYVLYAYPVCFGLIWIWTQIKNDNEDNPRTLAENIILMVWNTVLMVSLLTTLQIRQEQGVYVPGVLMLEFSIIAMVSSYSNNDIYAYLIAFGGLWLSIDILFKDGWMLCFSPKSCLFYAASFAILLIGIGWRWTYLSKHPEKQKSIVEENRKNK